MTSIAKEIGRSFVVSCFLPAAVFVAISRLFFFPIFFENVNRLSILAHSNFEQTLVLVGVVAAFLGYLLWSLNLQLVKLFEGYYFRRLLSPWTWRHKRRRTRMVDEVREAYEDYKQEQDADLREYLEDQFVSKHSKLEESYPNYGDVMPTAIGNAFRAFEQYPGDRYGIDAVLFWPHLTSVIPSDFCRLIEESNNILAFLLTSCLMCGLLGMESLAALAKLVVLPNLAHITGNILQLLISNSSDCYFYGLFAIAAFVAARWFEHRALDAGVSFGEVVRSCFDLYHQSLFEKMVKEPTRKDTKSEWRQLRRSILVDKRAWPKEWKSEEKTSNTDDSASRSCLERMIVSGLAMYFLIKDSFCKRKGISVHSSRKGRQTIPV